MADLKITDLPSLTTPASADLIEIIDVSDTTDSAQGSNKKITFGNLIPVLTEVEVDFGTNPTCSKEFVVTDASISSGMLITAYPSGNVATDRVGNDSAWDSLTCTAQAGTGDLTLTVFAHPGPIVGKRKILYLRGV